MLYTKRIFCHLNQVGLLRIFLASARAEYVIT
jgi:hypothetical protein